jgi:hypothetical protein
MQSNPRKGRGSESRRPKHQSYHASGSARSRHPTGDNPPLFFGNQATISDTPESSRRNGTKIGAKATLTPNPTTHYRAALPQTFDTIASDTAAPLPFENPPHLQLRGRFSGSNLSDYKILFTQVFLGGELATRDCLLRLRTIASDQVRNNLGVALQHDDHGDPITVVTKRTTPSSSMWVTTGDVKIRFPSAEVARTVYTQQRQPSRGNNSGLGY